MHLYTGIGVALGFVVGILGHEYAQHRMAFARGDKTPKLMGRLKVAPQPHLDLLGTVVLPALFTFVALFATVPFQPMFGYAKPHALNRALLRNPTRDWVIVSLAGPALPLLAGVATGWIATNSTGAAFELTRWATITLLTLAVLELLPLPGMDGGRILGLFLSPSAAYRIEELAPYKALFLIVIFILPPLQDAVIGLIRVVCDAVAAGVCG